VGAAGELTVPDGVIGYGHLGGTCAMGPADDPAAVPDHACRVRGSTGLRVVDASSMPILPAGNTFPGCVMPAERVARMPDEGRPDDASGWARGDDSAAPDAPILLIKSRVG